MRESPYSLLSDACPIRSAVLLLYHTGLARSPNWRRWWSRPSVTWILWSRCTLQKMKELLRASWPNAQSITYPVLSCFLTAKCNFKSSPYVRITVGSERHCRSKLHRHKKSNVQRSSGVTTGTNKQTANLYFGTIHMSWLLSWWLWYTMLK